MSAFNINNPFAQRSDVAAQDASIFMKFITLLGARLSGQSNEEFKNSTIGRLTRGAVVPWLQSTFPEFLGGNPLNVAQGARAITGGMEMTREGGGTFYDPRSRSALGTVISSQISRKIMEDPFIGGGKFDKTEIGAIMDWGARKNIYGYYKIAYDTDATGINKIADDVTDKTKELSKVFEKLAESFGDNIETLIQVADSLGETDITGLKRAAESISNYMYTSGLEAADFAQRFGEVVSAIRGMGGSIRSEKAAEIVSQAQIAARAEINAAVKENRMIRADAGRIQAMMTGVYADTQAEFGDVMAKAKFMMETGTLRSPEEQEKLKKANKMLQSDDLEERRTGKAIIEGIAGKHGLALFGMRDLEETNLDWARSAQNQLDDMSKGVPMLVVEDQFKGKFSKEQREFIIQSVRKGWKSEELLKKWEEKGWEINNDILRMRKGVVDAIIMEKQENVAKPPIEEIAKANENLNINFFEGLMYAMAGKKLRTEYEIISDKNSGMDQSRVIEIGKDGVITAEEADQLMAMDNATADILKNAERLNDGAYRLSDDRREALGRYMSEKMGMKAVRNEDGSIRWGRAEEAAEIMKKNLITPDPAKLITMLENKLHEWGKLFGVGAAEGAISTITTKQPFDPIIDIVKLFVNTINGPTSAGAVTPK